MVNLQTTLKEFIQYIPTWREDFDLKNLLTEINKGDRQRVALINKDRSPQGIIDSSSLLSLIAKKRATKENLWRNSTTDLWQEVVLTLTSLSYQTTIDDFLASLPVQNHQQQPDYFIVDEVGRLLGILDTAKLLQELWSDEIGSQSITPSYSAGINSSENPENRSSYLNYRQTNRTLLDVTPKKLGRKTVATKADDLTKKQANFQALNPELYRLITQIPLPLTIESVRGEICYQNEYWHQEPKLNQNLATSAKVSGLKNQGWRTKADTITQKGLKRNKDRLGKSYYPDLDLNSTVNHRQKINNHCPTVSNLSLASLSNNSVQAQIDRLNLSLLNSPVEQKLAIANIDLTTENRSPGWYYYRLPLEIKSDCISISDSPNYWLVVATKQPLLQQLNNDDYWRQQQSKLKQLQDEFIVDITHDIKSPLTAIIGLSSLLKEEKLGTLNKSQLRHSQMIYHSGKRLINLINDFLDITRIAAGKLQLNLEVIELKSTCQQIYKQVTEKLTAIAAIKQDEQTIFPQLQLDIVPQGRKAIADKIYFGQILTRLLENALQLTSCDRLLGIDIECWSDWLAITVWNEGGGLSEAQQNFSALEFSQYTNFLTSQDKKQELGLALAQQLAQAHGGDISLISQEDYGTEVTLLLPLKSENWQSKAIIPLNEVDEPTINSLVLIVETSVPAIVDLSEKLQTLGYHCAIARNLTEALYKARCLKPRKIVLNSSFLATSEPNIVKILKSEPQTGNIPLVIATNSYCDRDTAQYRDVENNFSQQSLKENSPSDLNSDDQKYFASLASDFLSFPFDKAALAKIFPPLNLVASGKGKKPKNLTVLRLSLSENINQAIEHSALDFVFENISFSLSHHIIEADSLEQAHLLAKIWDIDVIIWDGATLESPETYLHSFAQSNTLASIPIITLDTRSTEAANQIGALAIFPCLLPANERSIQQLTQVIQIAVGLA